MKKIMAIALAAVMAFSMAACGAKEEPAVYRTGMGVVVSPSVTDATAEKAGKVQMNTTMAVATFDAEGKVVSVSFDVAQQALAVNADGTTADPAAADTRTKVEKGADYGMAKASGLGKEYYQQLDAMEDWMVGKTMDEITSAVTDGKATDADLMAAATIKLGDHLAALQKAWDTSVEVADVAKTGIGQNISVKGKAATADKDGSVQFDTNIVAAAFDAEGKVVWAKIDVAQNKATFTLTGDVNEEIDTRTKVEKGADYGMVKASSIGKEYYQQAEALGQWMTGKTVDQINAMKVYDKGDGSHTHVPAEEDLTSSVTITVQAYLAALTEAAENAE